MNPSILLRLAETLAEIAAELRRSSGTDLQLPGELSKGADVMTTNAGTLLSPRTLADRLGCDVRTIRRLRHAKKLPKPVKVGKALRWRPSDIDEWIANGGGRP